jgi:L-lactate dehydrogenase complex protein LldF
MPGIPLKIFKHDATTATADGERRSFVRGALSGYSLVRAKTQDSFKDYALARRLAAGIKWRAIEDLDQLLVQFEQNLIKHGTQVHWASDGAAAREIVLGIVKASQARKIIKSKTMTGEEIEINEALESAGCQVIESDLGEFIVQLRNEAPYHFVFPSMHLKRGEIHDDFTARFENVGSDEPENLTMIARRELRRHYMEADLGISGANFGIAETGQISITENEGNARLTCALPRVHIALMGIEKIIPKLSDLAMMQPMLGTAGTGQFMTGYNTLYSGPRQPGESDGPEAMHVVLLDNRRTTMLADPELRDALRCIRCGACLNVCPIFKNIGGHAYGVTYQGPIGSVISPHLRGLQDFKHLSAASSLCGACTETCPVQIDLHHHLLRNRRSAVNESGGIERWGASWLAWMMTKPRLYRTVAKLGLRMDRLMSFLHGTSLDPLSGWRKTRTLPAPPRESFTAWWRKRGRS